MITDHIKTAALEAECAINSFSCTEDTEYFVNEMLNLHRTLNQSFTGKVVIRFVQEMAKRYREGRYDGRNEVSCRLCNIMWEALKNNTEGFYFSDDINPSLPMV